jgi:hypothetical protein
MVTKTLFIATTLGLLLAASAARADHNRGVKYAIGGALLGVALAELAHDGHRNYERRYYYDDHYHGDHDRRRKHRYEVRYYDSGHHGRRHYHHDSHRRDRHRDRGHDRRH